MGQKVSTVKVTAQVAVVGGPGTVDTIKLVYHGTTCCRRRWKQIASFTFPQSGWSPKDRVKVTSSNVAMVPLEKLRKKDGDTPVRVTCMAGKVAVFRAEFTMSDLLHMMKRTEKNNEAVLIFSLVSWVVGNKEHKAYAFTDLFCNGKPCSGQEKAGKEKTNKEKAGKEKAGKEKIGKEKADKEKADKEKAGKEKAGKEKASHEKAGQEMASQEKARQEKASQKKAGQEKASQDKASQDKASQGKASQEKAGKEKTGKEKAGQEHMEFENRDDEFMAREGTACMGKEDTLKAVGEEAFLHGDWTPQQAREKKLRRKEASKSSTVKPASDYTSPGPERGPMRGPMRGPKRGPVRSRFWDYVSQWHWLALVLIMYLSWQEYHEYY